MAGGSFDSRDTFVPEKRPGWLAQFNALGDLLDVKSIVPLDEESLLGHARRNTDLQARLQIVDAYKKHPEIEREIIKEPVFILGFGRSGTTILQDVLSQDPQFRSVRKWEALFPAPPPVAETHDTDPRIAKAQGLRSSAPMASSISRRR